METMFFYKGTRDIFLNQASEVYLNGGDLFGKGMYLSPSMPFAKSYSKGFKKWGLVCTYQLSSDKVLYLIDEKLKGCNNNIISKKLKEVILLNKKSKTSFNHFKPDSVLNYPEFNLLHPEEQNNFISIIAKKNEVFFEKIKNDPDYVNYKSFLNKKKETYNQFIELINKNVDVFLEISNNLPEEVAIIKKK